MDESLVDGATLFNHRLDDVVKSSGVGTYGRGFGLALAGRAAMGVGNGAATAAVLRLEELVVYGSGLGHDGIDAYGAENDVEIRWKAGVADDSNRLQSQVVVSLNPEAHGEDDMYLTTQSPSIDTATTPSLSHPYERRKTNVCLWTIHLAKRKRKAVSLEQTWQQPMALDDGDATFCGFSGRMCWAMKMFQTMGKSGQ